MSTTIDELLVKIRGDTAELRSDLEKVKTGMGDFKREAESIGSTLQTAFNAVVIREAAQALFHYVTAGAEAAEATGDAAEAYGLAVEEMSRFNYAGRMTGTTSEAIGSGLKKLGLTMAEAASGGKEATAAFSQMGISIKNNDGSIRSSSEVLKEIATKFQGYANGPEKAALANLLFGKSFEAMIPFLNNGGDRIQSFMDEADKLGITLSKDVKEACEEFNRQLARLDIASKAGAVSIASELSPVLKVLADDLLSADSALSKVSGGVGSLVVFLVKGLASALEYVTGHFTNTKIAMKGVLDLGDALMRMDLKAFDSALQRMGAESVASSNRTWDSIKKIWTDGKKDIAGDDGKEGDKPKAPVIEKLRKGVESEGKKLNDSLDRLQADYLQKIAGLTSDGKQDPMKELEHRLSSGDLSKGGEGLSQHRQQVLETAKEYYRLKDAAEAAAKAEKDRADALEKGTDAQKKVDKALSDYQLKQGQLGEQTETQRMALELQNGELAKQLELMRAAGIATDDYSTKLMQAASTADAAKKQADAVARMRDVAEDSAGVVLDSFKTMLFEGFDEGLDSMGKSFARMLSKMLEEAALANLMQGLFGPKGGNGGLLGGVANSVSGFFGGGKALGGPVAAERSYLVGERGPEIFTPRMDGAIIPNHQLTANAKASTAPQRLNVVLSEGALNLTMRDWLEGALADAAAGR